MYQADTEKKTHNKLQDSTCDSEPTKQTELWVNRLLIYPLDEPRN